LAAALASQPRTHAPSSSVENPGRHRHCSQPTPPASAELLLGQGLHAVACAGQKVSAGHAAHVPLPTWPLDDPAGQGTHAADEEFPSKKKPAAHRHSPEATPPHAVVLVLAGHMVHETLPSAPL